MRLPFLQLESDLLYYDADGIRIFHARWEDVWPTLGLKHEDVALLWADPPYGVKEKTNRRSRGRGGQTKRGLEGGAVQPKDWAPVAGDDEPFDPTQLLVFPRAVLWGANNYAHKLPPTSSWLVWDKRDGTGENDNADGELAWTSIDTRRDNAGGSQSRTSRPGGPVRIFRHMWNGVCMASEVGEDRLHPTQKPVALATWGFQRAKLRPGDLVFSPYMGSGPEARAALDMGLRFIGCEIVEEYCRAAVNRLKQLPLFAEGV